MTGREWKPGDVANVNGAVCILTPKGYWEHGLDYLFSFPSRDESLSIRPLVVIDPEDREQVERLAQAFRDGDRNLSTTSIPAVAAALNRFASPPPPKPEEPQGLGAVVEDKNGERWVKVYGAGSMWQYNQNRDEWITWDDLAAVKVLSEGVTA